MRRAGAQARLRDLPSRVVIYLLLAACLFPEVGYLDVWRKLTAGLAGIGTVAPTGGALAQARYRIGAAPPRWLFDLLAQQPRSGSMGRNGGACWSAQSTTPS